MSVQQQYFAGTHGENGTAEILNYSDVVHLADIERARKMHVMRGVPNPEAREAEDGVRELLFNCAGNGGDNVRVCREWEMRAVLLERTERGDYNHVSHLQCLHFRRCERFQSHSLDSNSPGISSGSELACGFQDLSAVGRAGNFVWNFNVM